MTTVEIIGYVASALVVGTFTMKNMLWLRYVAVLSNFGFLAYGLLGELWPVFGLHLILLPLNLARIRQLRRLVSIASSMLKCPGCGFPNQSAFITSTSRSDRRSVASSGTVFPSITTPRFPTRNP